MKNLLGFIINPILYSFSNFFLIKIKLFTSKNARDPTIKPTIKSLIKLGSISKK
tara:strand:+ start:1046 stop:1207 length:162 start_codon:yes stop_codon:yes gene_type:complete